MKQRIISLLLALALLGTMLCGCGDGASGNTGGRKNAATQLEPEQVQEIEQRMLSDWGEYLDYAEGCYGNLLWAIDYAEAFLREPTAENLLKAQAVLSYARIYAGRYSIPTPSVSEAEIDGLIRAGVDADAFLPELDQAAEDQLALETTWDLLEISLYERVFSVELRDCFSRWLPLKREELDATCRYTATTTAYFLLQCGDAEAAADLRAELPSRCPRIAAQLPDSSLDADALFQEAGLALDRLSDVILAERTLSGEITVANSTLTEASGHPETFGAQLAGLDGDPPVLSMPQWLVTGEMTCHFGVEEESGDITTLEEFDEQAPLPTIMRLSATDVREEDFLNSLGEPTAFGWTLLYQTTEDGVTTAYYQYPETGTELALSWQDGEAKLFMSGTLVCLAPNWFAFLQLQ